VDQSCVVNVHLDPLIEEAWLRAETCQGPVIPGGTRRISLEGDPSGGTPLRCPQRRAIEWVENALAPLRGRMPGPDLRRLVRGIGTPLDIEALVWLTDMAGLPREEAAGLMRSNVRTLLRSALERLA